MPYKIGNLVFTGQAASQTVNGSVADVMVGDKYLYVASYNLNTVYVYNKNADGTFGSLVRSLNWVANDSYVQYICASGSSVPYGYAVYTKDGQDYLVGWSSSHALLFEWTIRQSDQVVVNRTQYAAPTTMGSYGRGGWDGRDAVWFWNRNDMSIYKWDLNNKTGGLTKVVGIQGSGYALDSSYTGSGLLVDGNYAYWGSGSNEADGFLGCFSLSNGSLAESIMKSGNLSSFGVTAISGNTGCIQINPTNRGVAYYFTFSNTVKTLFLTNLVVSNTTIPTTAHDDFDIQFDISLETLGSASSATFRALINGTVIKPFATLFPLPVTNNTVTVPISKMVLGDNTLTLELKDNYGGVSTKTFNITVTNNEPIVVTSVSRSTTHVDNVIFEAYVKDEPTDLMTYRVLLNDIVVNDWTVSGYNSPLTVRRSFRADQLNIGSNTITIEVKDNYKTNTEVVSGTSTVTKVNTKPELTVDMKGNTLNILMQDADGDMVRFRVLLNGEQVIPESGYSAPFPSPLAVTYTLPKKKTITNQINTVRVEVIDSAGDISEWSSTGVLGYSGLMFKDASSNFYTTDFGVLLKYLDVGVLYAREQSGIFEVFVENTLGYPVKNVEIKALQGDLHPTNEKVEVSLSNAPFAPESGLLYPDTYVTGDTLKFYVRLTMNDDAVGGGNFKIKVTGNAL
ncbi:hypothetical protein EL84_22125 [Paenibacillus sp. VT-400]|uniref:hypothetical protein n=1 Tax=Paenibacillus sp. VT-400 TaxID=1495853 RepID=UPI000649DF54|nr:hypothetical protein [Paenibacillus sp. VT-400]KLU54825.1 hypothetical protein EL84_22125 [Paenibacillus sp. VT-400]